MLGPVFRYVLCLLHLSFISIRERFPGFSYAAVPPAIVICFRSQAYASSAEPHPMLLVASRSVHVLDPPEVAAAAIPSPPPPPPPPTPRRRPPLAYSLLPPLGAALPSPPPSPRRRPPLALAAPPLCASPSTRHALAHPCARPPGFVRACVASDSLLRRHAWPARPPPAVRSGLADAVPPFYPCCCFCFIT